MVAHCGFLGRCGIIVVEFVFCLGSWLFLLCMSSFSGRKMTHSIFFVSRAKAQSKSQPSLATVLSREETDRFSFNLPTPTKAWASINHEHVIGDGDFISEGPAAISKMLLVGSTRSEAGWPMVDSFISAQTSCHSYCHVSSRFIPVSSTSVSFKELEQCRQP